MEDKLLPISISKDCYRQYGNVFSTHWHEHFEFLYFIEGEGVIECNSVQISVKPGDLVVVNSGELHSGCNTSNALTYYCIIVDPQILQSSLLGTCEVKYITPLTQNLILFENKITGNSPVSECIKRIIEEYENKSLGFELSMKSYIYQMFTLLIRMHIRTTLTIKEYDSRKKELERLAPVFEYIDDHYSEKITPDALARLSNISYYHFCHMFKKLTDKTVTDYINSVRINKASSLMCNGDINVTESALAVGFNDVNYFSRLFKKYKGMSPTGYKRKY
jgi:AraC-like DNA-binding protein